MSYDSWHFFIYHRFMPWMRRTLFKFLNQFFPKQANRWVFHSKPVGYRDNARALYDYVVKHLPDIKTVWLVDKPEEIASLRSRGVPAYHWRSLQGLKWLFLAGTLFTTHFGFNDLKSPRQRSVNLWHGMPLKSLGFTQSTKVDKNIHRNYEVASRQVDQWIATSPLTQITIASSFGAQPSQVGITGQPRTDQLFSSTDSVRSELSQLCGICPSDKLVLWAPTYRKPRTGLRDDGENLSDRLAHKPLLSRLNKLLEDTQSHLIVKLHQFEDWELPGSEDFGRIHLFTEEKLEQMSLELYDFLAAVEILITDYSSIYVDFLLLDRPIIFFVPDLEVYRRRRGFILEPYEFWTPGPKIKSVQELILQLEKTLRGEDLHPKQREQIRSLFHTYLDDKSCERVVDWLMS